MTSRKPAQEKPVTAPDPNAPYTYPRRVLLAVTGLSPQVVTETLYALVHLEPPFVPTEIRLLTTAKGAESARLTLLSEDLGWFYRIQKDYSLPRIKFDVSTIHALTAPDIRTRLENEQLADALTALVREVTSDKGCALHVSIAGGRKTMGFYAGYVLSLFGRPQDRLSHVLVSDRYEGHPEFFYPPPGPKTIYRGKEPLDANKAEVSLADIPFVRFGRHFDDRLREGKVTFSQAVAAAQRALDPAMLEFDWEEKCIRVGEKRIPMQPARLAFLSWLARRARDGKPGVTCPFRKYGKDMPVAEYAADYLRELAHLRNEDALTAARLRKGMNKAFFDQTKSRVMGDLRAVLGPEGARQYGIVDDGSRPKRHFVALPPERIRWIGEILDAPRKLAKSQTSENTGL